MQCDKIWRNMISAEEIIEALVKARELYSLSLANQTYRSIRIGHDLTRQSADPFQEVSR
jgi:hypothetical protein